MVKNFHEFKLETREKIMERLLEENKAKIPIKKAYEQAKKDDEEEKS